MRDDIHGVWNVGGGSNLTSYFWGGGSAAPAAEEGGALSTAALAETGGDVAKGADLVVVPGVKEMADPTLMTSMAAGTEEEDWLMVDSHLTAGSEDDDMNEAEALEDLHPLRSDIAAPAITSPPGMEESWIIAPTPTTIPCLVESAMEVSPLETLLIEHPSMSVYHKLESPVRSLKLSTSLPAPAVISPPSSSKPEAPTIESPHQLTPPVQSTQGSQTKKLVVKKTSSNQKSKQPAKPPQIPFILRQKAQKHKPVPESPTTMAVAKTKPAPSPAKQQRDKTSPVKTEVVPNKMSKGKSKKVTISTVSAENKQATSGKKLLGEIQNVVVSVAPITEKPAVVKVAKKPAPAPMNRIVECNIKEMFPAHVYPKDMRPFVEDFQNNVNTRQHRELIAAQRRSQLAMTRAKRSARRNPFSSTDTTDDVKTEAAAMMEQKENNVVEMRRQEQFEILLRSSQKQQQKRLDQNLRKNHLTRSNKVIHEMSARNKRQRRNDHSNKPSGANNNRKSQ